MAEDAFLSQATVKLKREEPYIESVELECAKNSPVQITGVSVVKPIPETSLGDVCVHFLDGGKRVYNVWYMTSHPAFTWFSNVDLLISDDTGGPTVWSVFFRSYSWDKIEDPYGNLVRVNGSILAWPRRFLNFFFPPKEHWAPNHKEVGWREYDWHRRRSCAREMTKGETIVFGPEIIKNGPWSRRSCRPKCAASLAT